MQCKCAEMEQHHQPFAVGGTEQVRQAITVVDARSGYSSVPTGCSLIARVMIEADLSAVEVTLPGWLVDGLSILTDR